MKQKIKWAVMAMAAWMVLPPLWAPAAPPGPGAPRGTEQYDAETRARLEDNRIEYDELRALIHEYNPNVAPLWDTYRDSKEDFANIVTEMESQYAAVKSLAEGYISAGKLTGSKELSKAGYDVDRSYRKIVQGMRDRVDKWDTDKKSTNMIRMVERQLTAGTQSAMIGYETIRQNIATLETMVQLYEQQADMAGRMAGLGMATETDLASANADLLSARSQLASLNSQLESTRRTLCMLLGYDPDSNPEICPIPEFDMARIGGMDLEQDTIKAIGNNYTLISQRTSPAGESSAQIAARLGVIEEGEQKLSVEMQRLYQQVMDSKAAYEAASVGFEAAQASQAAAGRQYQLGLLSQAQYVGTQIAYCQKKAAKESANLSLLQAMENYGWAVMGLASVPD